MPKTLNGARECIGAIFRHAIEEKYLDENPLRKLKKFKIEDKGNVKFYTDEQLLLIFENIDPFWRNHIKFFYLTGLRKAELINLIWENVDLKQSQISIVSGNGWKTKTGKSRIVPLNAKAVHIIKKFQNKNKIYVFTTEEDNKIHLDKPYHELKNTLEKLGLTGDIHKLRHTFAAKLVMSGKNIYDVSKLLGHADIKTTEIYAHLAPDYLKNVVDVL
jgi:integrase